MFYLIVISSATLLISILNVLLDGIFRLSAFGWHLLFTLLGVMAVFAVDGIAAFVIRRLPEAWFRPDSPVFEVSKKEKNLYRKLKLNAWKKYVPEWGCFTGFHKDKLQSADDRAYLGRFLLESNYGVAGHLAGAVLGFLILLLPFLRPLSMALPIAVINMILSLLPTMILRFNTPALRRLYQRHPKHTEQTEPTLK